VDCGSYAERYAIDCGLNYLCGQNHDENNPKVSGDADGDGTVDIDDALAILEYCSGEGTSISTPAADVNADGDVDLYDALLILQFEAGWNVTLS
jgi:hypothetical protein